MIRATNRSHPAARKNRVAVRRAMNFEKYAAESNYIINQVAVELGADRNTAARVTRSVLHALRDRLQAEDAVEFAQGLPMGLKGVFFDQYDLSRVPVLLRHPDQFIDYVRLQDGRAAIQDYPTKGSVEDAIAAVMRVLERNMDHSQVDHIKHMMNEDLAYLFY